MSEAMNLGRSIIKHGDGSKTLSRCEGCAVGMALAAVGEEVGCSQTMIRHWPWTTYQTWADITRQYNEVVSGERTLDQIIDYVRSIEPPEVPESKELTQSVETHASV